MVTKVVQLARLITLIYLIFLRKIRKKCPCREKAHLRWEEQQSYERWLSGLEDSDSGGLRRSQEGQEKKPRVEKKPERVLWGQCILCVPQGHPISVSTCACLAPILGDFAIFHCHELFAPSAICHAAVAVLCCHDLSPHSCATSRSAPLLTQSPTRWLQRGAVYSVSPECIPRQP